MHGPYWVFPFLFSMTIQAQNPDQKVMGLQVQKKKPNPSKWVLIGTLKLSLGDPEVNEGHLYLRNKLPPWAIKFPFYAAKLEVPRAGLLLKCMVASKDEEEAWEFVLDRNKGGQLHLRSAKLID